MLTLVKFLNAFPGRVVKAHIPVPFIMDPFVYDPESSFGGVPVAFHALVIKRGVSENYRVSGKPAMGIVDIQFIA